MATLYPVHLGHCLGISPAGACKQEERVQAKGAVALDSERVGRLMAGTVQSAIRSILEDLLHHCYGDRASCWFGVSLPLLFFFFMKKS